MSQLDELDGRPSIHTTEAVNRYPDFVRCLVRQLKALFPVRCDNLELAVEHLGDRAHLPVVELRRAA